MIDLVCKMEISENAAKPSLVLEGTTYYFCSEGCRAEFERHPQEYLQPAEIIGGESSSEEKTENV